MTTKRFAVTWDYRCPFARNAHEHVVAGLDGGADWDVEFIPFSLSQVHVAEGAPSVWQDDSKAPDLLALEAGLVVRDRIPDSFHRAHLSLFAARHDHAGDLRDKKIVRRALEDAGVDPDVVLPEVEAGWPRDAVRRAHEEAAQRHAVFGVPTFVIGDQAAFVRVTSRPGEDSGLAIETVDRILDLVEGHPSLNELKHTAIPR